MQKTITVNNVQFANYSKTIKNCNLNALLKNVNAIVNTFTNSNTFASNFVVIFMQNSKIIAHYSYRTNFKKQLLQQFSNLNSYNAVIIQNNLTSTTLIYK